MMSNKAIIDCYGNTHPHCPRCDSAWKIEGNGDLAQCSKCMMIAARGDDDLYHSIYVYLNENTALQWDEIGCTLFLFSNYFVSKKYNFDIVLPYNVTMERLKKLITLS